MAKAIQAISLNQQFYDFVYQKDWVMLRKTPKLFIQV